MQRADAHHPENSLRRGRQHCDPGGEHEAQERAHGDVHRDRQRHEDLFGELELQQRQSDGEEKKENDQDRAGRPEGIDDRGRLIAPEERRRAERENARDPVLQTDGDHAFPRPRIVLRRYERHGSSVLDGERVMILALRGESG